jgi:hypothetical protein
MIPIESHAKESVFINVGIAAITERDYEPIYEEEPESEPQEIESYKIPSYGGMKTWMSYTKITDSSSDQYKLQKEATTDENGLRMIGDRYCVAIGTHFNLSVGDKFDLLLENGTRIPCVVGDIKSNVHTDSSHIFTMQSSCMSEFITDVPHLQRDIKRSGDVSSLCDEWNSPVTELVVIEKRATNEK